MPIRVQLSRAKGWKMPPNTVYVGRPTKWGNPWGVTHICSAEQAVANYREWVGACNYLSTIDLARVTAELRGKNLACWCSLLDVCHADVLLEIANAEVRS